MTSAHYPSASQLQYPIVPQAPKPDDLNRFAPAYGTERTIQNRETPVVGTRYCQHLHAYVPEDRSYRITPLAAARPPSKAPLKKRICSREFWHLSSTRAAIPRLAEDESEDPVVAAAALLAATGAGENSAKWRGVEIRVVPRADGSAVLAEGLTHHQAALVPLDQAQKDVGIKYRSLTRPRSDLKSLLDAQVMTDVKYRAVGLAV